GNKPPNIMSGTSQGFLEKSFEQEIPEIADGIITIQEVARIPGAKAKVAAESYNETIHAVGAWVGAAGSRMHGSVRELGNENIDVISYTNNAELYIQRALSAAKINNISINETSKRANVLLDISEVSKAIGKGGQNIKLASLLTGYEIDVIRE